MQILHKNSLGFRSDSALMTVQEKWEERKRFVWYSLYGWLTPVVIVSFIFFGKQFDFLPLSLQPKLGDAKCLLYSVAGNYSKLAFFLVPITILKICDVILFVKTTIHCMEVKNAINNMKDQDRKKMFIADKERWAKGACLTRFRPSDVPGWCCS